MFKTIVALLEQLVEFFGFGILPFILNAIGLPAGLLRSHQARV
jgi:hypothetical protein